LCLIDFYLGASLRVGLLRISLCFRTSSGWFPFGSFESLALFLLIVIFLGDAFSLSFGLAYARLLLRNELNPAHPHRANFMLKYDLGDIFGTNFCCLFTFGNAFQDLKVKNQFAT
ncbi:MAG: hypothetical protein ACO291_07860, partial [Bacteroidia bacterium]